MEKKNKITPCNLEFYNDWKISESLETFIGRCSMSQKTVLVDLMENEGKLSEPDFELLKSKIDYCLSNGIDINEKNENSTTALIYACCNVFTNINIIRYLIEKGANINEIDKSGRTALNCACYNLDFEIAELLLENGTQIDPYSIFNLFNSGDEQNADFEEKLAFIKLLLQKNKDILKARDNDGMTPLMYISRTKNYFYGDYFDQKNATLLIDLFLKNGTDVNYKCNAGRTALHYANIDPEDFNEKFKNKRSSHKQIPIPQRKNMAYIITKKLLEKGADINSTDIQKQTPLMYAVDSLKFSAAKLLIKKGADLTLKDNEGKDAKMHAQKVSKAFTTYLEIAEFAKTKHFTYMLDAAIEYKSKNSKK